MSRLVLPWLSLLAVLLATAAASAEPLKQHPDNPRYLWFRGKPTVLITSGEHYGAVLNGDFDYVPYLDELKARDLNLTRTFTGTYREIPGTFNIEHNTLTPAPGKYVAPWARTKTPGAIDGTKFDLSRWNPEYFTRLKDFIGQAGKRGIVVELVLFCTFYSDNVWNASPMNARNNVNDVEKVGNKGVFTTKNKKLLAYHDAFVRKVIAELKDFDNVYYEICNEPYFADVRPEWQAHIAQTIADAEAKFPHRHLIAQNIANGSAKVVRPDKHVAILNFHYAAPPNAVAMNYELKRVLGDDETGFKGTGDFAYRSEGWDFVIAGGAIYSSLDYSFTPRHPKGDYKHKKSPGGGGATLRKQLTILKHFIESFDFVKMAPHNDVIKGGIPAKATARCLAESGVAYAVYVKGGTQATLRLVLPKGSYRAEWIDTRTGAVAKREQVRAEGEPVALTSPRYTEDVALRVRSAK